MAITAVNRAAGTFEDTIDEFFDTSSVAFQNNRLYLLSVVSFISNSTPVAVTGGGLTWVEEEVTGDVSGDAISVWRGLVTSGASTGAVTVEMDAAGITVNYSIDEFDGVDTSGTNGSGAIVQSESNNGVTATSGAVTLAAFGSGTNAAFGSFETANGTARTPDSSNGGYTELSDQTNAGGSGSLQTQWNIGSDTSVSSSWTSISSWAGIGVEIKEAAAAAAPTPIMRAGAGRRAGSA